MKQDIFFDLDHTLWDFEGNARETLLELFDTYKVQQYSSVSKAEFVQIYLEINDRLWVDYRSNIIKKEFLRTERFRKLFITIGYPEQHIPKDIWQNYLNICPTKTHLIPGARNLLEYLQDNYKLHLITNGFAETQRRKLKHSDLGKYFRSLTISEEVGVQKPHEKIFKQALVNAGSKDQSSVYVGDNFHADVMGGLNAGWDVFWYIADQTNNSDHKHPQLTKIDKLADLKTHF